MQKSSTNTSSSKPSWRRGGRAARAPTHRRPSYCTVPKLRAANVEDGLGLERASSPNQAPPPREFIAWIGDGTGLAASRVFSWLPCWNLSPMIAQSRRVGSTAVLYRARGRERLSDIDFRGLARTLLKLTRWVSRKLKQGALLSGI